MRLNKRREDKNKMQNPSHIGMKFILCVCIYPFSRKRKHHKKNCITSHSQRSKPLEI